MLHILMSLEFYRKKLSFIFCHVSDLRDRVGKINMKFMLNEFVWFSAMFQLQVNKNVSFDQTLATKKPIDSKCLLDQEKVPREDATEIQ